MGRDDEVEVEVGDLVLVDDGLDALEAGDHADLVEVGHDGGGAVLEDALGERADGEVGALGVDVAVDEAGGDVVATGVDDLGALADAVVHVAHGRDATVADGDAAVVDLCRVDIDDLAALDDEVGGHLALGDVQKLHVHVRSYLSVMPTRCPCCPAFLPVYSVPLSH